MPITDPEMEDPRRSDGLTFGPQWRAVALLPDIPWHRYGLVCAATRRINAGLALAAQRGWLR